MELALPESGPRLYDCRVSVPRWHLTPEQSSVRARGGVSGLGEAEDETSEVMQVSEIRGRKNELWGGNISQSSR